MKRALPLLLLVLPGGSIALGAWWWWRKHRMRADVTDLLSKTMPNAVPADVDDFAGAIADAMARYDITTPERRAAFIAQIAEESDELWHLREHYGTPRGEEYADGSQYEGRGDLGNTQDGDGTRFKGRGLLQITGRANYELMGEALGVDLVSQPELLNEPKWSALAAADYWADHGCNELADAGDFKTITRRINGGLTGLTARLVFLSRATAASQESA